MSISQDIESRIDIVQLVSRYVTLKKSGVNFKGLSPFVQEKTPSFVVSPAKNIAYCFSSHRGGGPIKFLMEMEKVDYHEALQILAKEAGVELKTNYAREKKDNTLDIYDIHEAAARIYHENIFSPKGKKALDYLLRRGITEDTIKKFQLGYSPEDRSLYDALHQRGAKDQDLIDSGVFVSAGRDKFRGRVVFPIANFTGHTVAFTARALSGEEPKYLNSPASRIFSKGSILYGLHLAKSDIAKKRSVLVVEGQMDTVALHQAGYTHAVGISGTALTHDHIQLLRRLADTVYLLLDGDRAGVQATFASIENLMNEDMDIRVVSIPAPYKDPDEYLKAGGDLNVLVAESLSHVGFFIARAADKYNLNTTVGKKHLVRDVVAMLRRLKSAVEVDLAIGEVARLLDISRDTVYEEYRRARPARPTVEPTENTTPWWSLEDKIVGYLTAYGFFDLFFEKFAYTIADMEMSDSSLVLRKVLENGREYISDATLDQDALKCLQLSMEEENLDTTDDVIRQRFIGYVKALNRQIWERDRQSLSIRMRESSSDPSLLQSYSDLLRKGKELGVH